MIKHKQERLKQLRNRNPGYLRHFNFRDRFPKQEVYEADEEDIKFLAKIFPDKINPKKRQRELVYSDVVQEFERVIQYLEITEDTNFKQFRPGKIFSIEIQEQIVSYWVSKCQKFKRPLLRKNWKQVLTVNKYGVYDK